MGLPLVIAHRGASAQAPENTWAAFRLAAQQGADAIETDLRLTADGVPVLFHDAEVDRTTDGRGPLAALTWAQVRRLDAGAWFSSAFRAQRPLRLEELLSWLSAQPSLHLFLEIKGEVGEYSGLEELVILHLRDTPLLQRTTVISFQPWRIARVGALLPSLATGLIYHQRPADPLEVARHCGARALLPHLPILEDADVERAHEAGLPLYVWTVDEPEALRRVAGLGVDGIMTNEVALARGVLGALTP